MERKGVWRDDPDIRAFWALVEELRARGPAVARRKGTRFGVGLTGAAYYRDLELWAQTPRPDIAAFWALVAELKGRQREDDPFVTRLRTKLAEVASLSVADRRQAIGVTDEYLDLALSGGRVPALIAERLAAFVGAAAG
jgi:hypothetical protein